MDMTHHYNGKLSKNKSAAGHESPERRLPGSRKVGGLRRLRMAFMTVVMTLGFTATFAQTNGLHFDGSDDYVSVASPFYAFGNAITVEWWANITSAPVGSGIGQGVAGADFMSTNVWLMHSHGDGTIQFFVNDNGNWRSSGQVSYGSGWHHYAGVASPSGVFFYIDGTLVTSSSVGISSGILNVSSSVVHLGKDVRFATGRFMGGSMDEVRIWNRALCQSEIQANRSCQLTGTSGLVEYYKLNEGTAGGTNTGINTTADGSGNGRTGILNGFGLSGSTSNWITGNVSGTCSVYNAVTGNTTLSTAITTQLSASITGGTWTSSNTVVGTINTTGMVTGLTAGTSTISYTTTSGGCNTTTTTNITVNTPDAGLYFDGTNDYVAVPNNSSLESSAGTVEMWIKPTWTAGTRSGNPCLGSMRPTTISNTRWSFHMNNGLDGIGLWNGSTYSTVGYTFTSNKWYHVAFVFSTSSCGVYVNGVFVGNTGNAIHLQTGHELRIGMADDTYFNEAWMGYIDEVRIWNNQRTSAEIAGNMNCDIAQNSNLVGYYRFNNGLAGGTNTGLGVTDYSGNSNCGSLTNFALTGSTSNFATGAVGTCTTITGLTPLSITGAGAVCVGATLSLSDATSGGSWLSANIGVATVSSSGVVSGVSAGSVAISYIKCGMATTEIVTVNPSPDAGTISATQDSICATAGVFYTTTGSGGVWSSSNTLVATVNPTTGTVFGIYGSSTMPLGGTAIISYTATNSCGTAVATKPIYIRPFSDTGTVSPISGTTICAGSTVNFSSNSVTTGLPRYLGVAYTSSWTSSATSIATVNAAGEVTGVSAGTAKITYTASGCGNFRATRIVTVNTPPTISPITGNTTLSTAITTQLSDATTGGTWTSSNTTVGTVNSSTGLVTGLSGGTTSISYTVTSSGCSITATTNVTVNTPNSGLRFDGANDYISFDNDLSSVTDFTYEAWVYMTTNAGWSRILDFSNGTSNGIVITPSTGGTMRPRMTINVGGDTRAVESSSAMSLNTWTHIAVTVSGSTATLYLNGVQVAQNTAFGYTPSSVGATPSNFIGKSQYADPYFPGTLDDIRIWNVARTQAQIQANMNCDVAPNANLIAYYRFDEGVASGTNTSRSVVADYSGNGRCGTLNNFALTGSSSNYVTGAVGTCNAITLVQPITGTTSVCAGGVTSLSDATTSGTWSSSNTSVATVGSSNGVVSGVTAGSVTITYTICGVSVTASVVVNALPTVASITGNTTLSTAITTQLNNGTGGGTWTSSNTAAGTISTTGLVTGLTEGTSNISYTVTSLGCSTTVTTNVTVKTPNVGLSFDGGNDYVDLGTLMTSGQSYTKEAWIYLTSSGLNNNIIGSGDCAFWVPGGYLRAGQAFSSGGSYVDDPTPFTFNKWTHVAVSYDAASSTMKLYRNGQLVATNSSAMSYSAGTMWLGAYNAGTNLLQGKMDEVRLWNTARTQAQIQANMNCDVAQNSNLMAYYRFDNGVASGTNTSELYAVDYSGNNNCGTLNNFAMTGSSSNFVTGAVGGCNTISMTSPGAITGTLTICKNATTTLSGGATGGTWSSASSNVTVGATNGVVTGVTAGTAIVTYKLNCLVSTATITINDLPSVTVSTSGPTTFCDGDSVVLSASGSFSGLSWTPGEATTSSITVLTSGNYSVTVTNASGCSTTSSATSVTVNAAPGPIAGDTSALCPGATLALSNAVSGGTWSGGSSAVSVDSSGSVHAISAGRATVVYTLSSGCYSTRIVNVNANPSTSINVTGSSVFCEGGSAVLTPSITGSTTFFNAPAASGATTVCDCPPGYVAVGLSGGAGTWMDRFTIHCQQLVGGTLTGGTVATSSNGTSGGGSPQGPYFFSGNKVMVGASVVASWANTLNSITGYGQDVAYVAAGGDNSVTPTALTGIGGWSGTSDVGNLYAPAGMVVTGMYTYDNWFSTGVAFRYKPISEFSTAVTVSNPYIWSTGDTTPTVTAVTSGAYGISYTAPGGCTSATSVSIEVNPLPGDISGVSVICAGAITEMSNSSTDGVWTSSDPAIATIDAATGELNAVTAGTTTIAYVLPTGCTKSMILTVNPVPAIIAPDFVCEGSVITLGATIGGGVWVSSNDSVATVDTAGAVFGSIPGFVTIFYSLPTGCATSRGVLVHPLPHVGMITGESVLAAGATTLFNASPLGGTWISSNDSVATVSSAGNVTGVRGGVAAISYSVSNICGTDVSTKTITVISAIGGDTSLICAGSTRTLSGMPSGGVWSSSNTVRATVSAAGVVTGLAVGTAVISYNAAGSLATVVLTVSALPSLGGASAVCVGTTTTLNGSGGGTWSSSVADIAAVGATGIVTGNMPGTATIAYTISNGCKATRVMTVNAIPETISGPTNVCVGATMTLGNSVAGGSWSSSSVGLATVGTAGNVTGVAVGAPVITYAIGSCRATQTVNVLASPALIGGSAKVCPTTTATLTDATVGGVWSSGDPTVGTVSATGVVTGVVAGTVNILYTMSNGCYRSAVATINPNPADITGAGSICAGASTSLTSTTTGLQWTSSDNSKATIGITSGVVTGVAVGTAKITYKNTTTGCLTTTVIAVSTSPASITGTAFACTGATTTLGNTTGGGVWSSSDPTIATISTGGVVTGVSNGTTAVAYTIAGGCSRSVLVTINASPAISGSLGVCLGKSTLLTSTPVALSWASSNTAVAPVATGSVAGMTVGTADITITAAAGCKAVVNVTVNPLPPVISGTLATCVGSTTTLSNAMPSGTWSSYAPANASINSAGEVTGLVESSVLITYTSGKGCVRTAALTVNPAPTILGMSDLCVGTSASLYTGNSGTWSSGNASKVTVGLTTGVLTGVSAGTATISYISTIGCPATAVAVVNTTPDAINGSSSVCAGGTLSLSNGVGGGNWSSSNNTYVTVGSSSGNVTGTVGATATISYTIGSCSATRIVTILATPAAIGIVGSTSICEGATTSVVNSGTGVWSTLTPTITTVSAGGIVTGGLAGNGTIVFTGTNGCQTSRVVTVTVCSSRQAITGVGSSELNTKISMFPNPTNGMFTIQTPEAGTLSVLAVDGKEVVNYQIKEGDTNIVLPKDLAAGVYMCRFNGNEGSGAMVRLIYQHD